MATPAAAYRAALRHIKAYAGAQNDTDAAALEALQQRCIAPLCAAHTDLADLTNGWSDDDGDAGAAAAAVDNADAAAAAVAPPPSAAAEQKTKPLVEHSYDLGTDEPGYLLAASLLALAELREARGELALAYSALRAALAVFPSFIAARVAAARVALAGGGSTAHAVAERHLRAAVAAARELAAADEGMLSEANRVCARELSAGNDARRALAMLLAQAGGPERDGEAAALLREVGFSWRLARGVLCYLLPPTGAAAAACAAAAAAPVATNAAAAAAPSIPLAVLDGALPAALLAALRRAFAPDGPFWAAHNYGPRQGYFSYAFPLSSGEGQDGSSSSNSGSSESLLGQLATSLAAAAAPHFPAVGEARWAEFWAHCRRHGSGHQLHFDAADEGEGGVRNPIVSSVLYLDCGSGGGTGGGGGGSSSDPNSISNSSSNSSGGGPLVGGPTLVTDQSLGGPLASKGWLAYPAPGRVTLFDGSVLHGVIPGRGASPNPNPAARRTTLMVAFWRDLKVRPAAPGARPGAAMPLPPLPGSSGDGRGAGDAAPAWLKLVAPIQLGERASTAPALVAPLSVAPVWEPIDAAAAREKRAPSYDLCFQGF